LTLSLLTAWYDYDLVGYQKERTATELEKTFDERQKYLAEKGIELKHDEFKPKQIKDPETEWQKSVKEKKGQDYYEKLSEIEVDQLLREQRIREQSHQYAIPGEKIVKSSAAKGMAAQYEQSL
jgi:titin